MVTLNSYFFAVELAGMSADLHKFCYKKTLTYKDTLYDLIFSGKS